jgi:hypothetical protein
MNIDKDFYCENRQDEAMLPCGEQCSTCKSMNHPNIEVSGITPEESIPLGGFQITIIPSHTIKDGNPIMMMSENDYKAYSEKLKK